MGQAKGVILFQSGFYSGGEGPAREFGSWERPTSRAGPHGHDTVYPTLRRAVQPRIGLGRCGHESHSAPLPDLRTGFHRRSWAPAQTGSRLAPRLDRDSPRSLQPLRQNLHLPAAVFSALRPLQPDRTQPSATALLPGRPLLGRRRTHRQRPGSRGGSLHPAPMVPPSGFFSAVVFCSAPDDAGHKRLVGQD
jgi:hypothetical protein